MSTEHPITPPSELVEKWKRTAPHRLNEHEHYHYVTLCAAQWGADQELEECCEWLRKDLDAYELVGLRAVYLDHNLYTDRRPEPPSLKEQALQLLETYNTSGVMLTADQVTTIRCALEALDD